MMILDDGVSFQISVHPINTLSDEGVGIFCKKNRVVVTLIEKNKNKYIGSGKEETNIVTAFQFIHAGRYSTSLLFQNPS